jgi:hypothetical protein
VGVQSFVRHCKRVATFLDAVWALLADSVTESQLAFEDEVGPTLNVMRSRFPPMLELIEFVSPVLREFSAVMPSLSSVVSSLSAAKISSDRRAGLRFSVLM